MSTTDLTETLQPVYEKEFFRFERRWSLIAIGQLVTMSGTRLAATTQWRSIIGANLPIWASSRITDSSTYRCQQRRLGWHLWAAFTLSRWRYPVCPPQQWLGERRTRASHTSTRYWTNAVWRSASWPACRRAIGTNCWSVNQRVSTHIVCSFDMYMIIVNLEGKWNDKSKPQKNKFNWCNSDRLTILWR